MKRVLPVTPHLTVHEMFAKLVRAKRPRRLSHELLRAKVTLAFAMETSGLSQTEFAEKHVYRERANSSLVNKWVSGKHALNRNSAKAFEKSLPGTLAVFDLPLFELLKDAPIEEARVAELLEPYRVRDGHFLHGLCVWGFPDFHLKLADKTLVPIMGFSDMENLQQYGTVDSFSVILGIMRAAESRGNVELHCLAASNAFRALPMVLRHPGFSECAVEIGRQLVRIRNRVLFSAFSFDVNWRLIRRQAKDPKYHSFRYRWPRDANTGRFLKPEDPILPAEFVSGWASHIRERRRLAAGARKRHSRST